MECAATHNQHIYSSISPNNTNISTYGTTTSYLSSNNPSAVMYGGGSSSNGAAPPSHSVATIYAPPAHASSNAAVRQQQQQAQGTLQQSMNQSQANTSFNAYGGGTASGSSSGFFYPAASTQPAGAQPMYSANPSAAAMFPVRGGSASMTPAHPAPTQMLTPQTNAAVAAAAAWSSAAANINAGSKLFVGQVPAVCTEDQLRPLFSQFGNLLEIKIMREPNGRSKGSAWVRYELEESAQRAIAALNEKHVVPPQTNPLRVQFAAPSTNRLPQASQSQSLSTLGSIMQPSAATHHQQQQQQQQQVNYTTAATYTTPQGYAGATTAYMQSQYATSPNLMAVRAPQQHTAVHSTPGKIEYLRSNQPGSVIYSTASPSTVDAMQQQQQRQQPQSPQQQQQQQQQLVYATGGQMRAGVMYASDAFAMTNQMTAAATAPQQQHQQHHQWCG